jgi:FkbM family methyltransferase
MCRSRIDLLDETEIQMDGLTIFDIGCNNGDDTDYYLKKGFKVVAVDADKSMCDMVSNRFPDEIKAGNCVVVHGAFSETGTAVTFYICDEKPDWNTCDPYFVEINRKQGVTYRELVVPPVSMRDLIAAYGRPYYVKIDIEGMDIVPLRSLVEETVKPTYISLEVPDHDLTLGLEQFLLLKRLGCEKFYYFNQGMRGSVKTPNPPREGRYAEFEPDRFTTGPFGKDLDEEWISFDRAVQHFLKLNRLHVLFQDNKWFSKNGQFGGTIVSKIYNRYRRHVLGDPVTRWYDLHAKVE